MGLLLWRDRSRMPRRLSQTLSRRLPVFDIWLLITGTVFLMPFLTSSATLDPALAPRFLVWAVLALAITASFAVQAAVGSPTIDWSVLRPALFLPFLGYLASSLVSLGRCANLGEGIYESAKIFLSLVFLAVSIIILNRKDTHIAGLAKAMTLSAAGLSAVGFYQFVSQGGHHVFSPFGVTGTMGNKNLFASGLFLMLPFCLFVVLRFPRFWRMLGAYTTGAILVLILLSRTRTVWFALVVSGSLTMIAWLLRRYRCGLCFPEDMGKGFLRRLCQILLVALVFGAGVGLFLRQSHTVPEVARSVFDTVSINQRLSAWKKTLEIIRDNPLGGVGAGNWKIILPSYGMPDELPSDWSRAVFFVRPHNDFLWVFSEMGAPGFLCYAAVFGVALFYTVQLIRRCTSAEDGLLALLSLFGLTGYLAIAVFCFPRERVFHSLSLLLLMATVTVIYHRNHPIARGSCPRWGAGLIAVSFPLLFCVAVLGYVRLSADIHTQRALVARAYGNHHAVIASLDKAHSRLTTLDPVATPLKWYRGEAYFQSGNLTEALKDYEQALAAHPNHIYTLNNLATCHLMAGNQMQAIHYYERTLRICPRFAEAACNLAAVYFNAEEYEKAWEVLVASDPATQNPVAERYKRLVASRMQNGGMPSTAQKTTRCAAVGESTRHAAGHLFKSMHRLWSATHGRHFYTIDARERDAFLKCPLWAWICEGVDCQVFAEDRLPGLHPVHRFYSPSLRAYFYTIQSAEVQRLIVDENAHWQHEGVAFFAFPPGSQPTGTFPMYRFWSGRLGHHLFTIDGDEKNDLITRHANVWTFEGIAWYAYR